MDTVTVASSQTRRRVELPAHTDEWAMGDRYGWAGPEYLSYGVTWIDVVLEKSGRTVHFRASMLNEWGRWI